MRPSYLRHLIIYLSQLNYPSMEHWIVVIVWLDTKDKTVLVSRIYDSMNTGDESGINDLIAIAKGVTALAQLMGVKFQKMNHVTGNESCHRHVSVM